MNVPCVSATSIKQYFNMAASVGHDSQVNIRRYYKYVIINSMQNIISLKVYVHVHY